MPAKTARVGYDDVPVLRTPNVAIQTTTDSFAAEVTRMISGASGNSSDKPQQSRSSNGKD